MVGDGSHTILQSQRGTIASIVMVIVKVLEVLSNKWECGVDKRNASRRVSTIQRPIEDPRSKCTGGCASMKCYACGNAQTMGGCRVRAKLAKG